MVDEEKLKATTKKEIEKIQRHRVPSQKLGQEKILMLMRNHSIVITPKVLVTIR